ncbi:SCO4225 family membrane protein [Streptomyces sp. NPDC058220]|uniref:SCO4225 family membrane protein n=1 Tax=unclassified Streptomyces TaxID=2593676 RepID=UPI003665E488
MNGNSTVRRVVDAVVGNWASRVYLAVAAALIIWVGIDTAFVAHDDASFAGIFPLLFTAPTSLLVLFLDVEGMAVLPFLAVAALVNAAVIGLTVHKAGGGGTAPNGLSPR